MSQGSDMNESVTVSNDGVTVEKTVTSDEFPVPAVVFTLQSNASAPVHVRLTDQIPDSFPMERVGFHPEFESERWTAYKDQRVEFERDLEPGESVRTVYGIRADDPTELSAFLTEPQIKEVAASENKEAADIEGVLGPDNSQLIRDVLSGERSSLPGVDEDEDEDQPDPLDPDGATPDPLSEVSSTEITQSDGPKSTSDPFADDPDGEFAIETDAAPDTADNTLTEAVDDGVEIVDEEPVASDEHAEIDEREPVDEDEPIDADDHAVKTDTESESEVEVEVEIAEETATEATIETETETTVGADSIGDTDDELEPVVEATKQETEASSETTSEHPEDSDSETDSVEDTSETTDKPPVTAVDTANTEPEPDAGSSLVAVQGGISAVLASEIRNGNVSEEDLSILKKELGTGVPRSFEVRLNRLQSNVEDIAAYSDALAEFIDDNGTAEELFTTVQNELEGLSEAVDDLSVSVAAADEERTELAADITTTKSNISALTDRVERTESTVDAVEEATSDLDDDLGSIVDDVDSLGDDVSEAFDEIGDVSEDIDATVEQIETVADDLAQTDSMLDSFEIDLEETATTAGEAAATADRVVKSVDTIKEDVEDATTTAAQLEESVDSVSSSVQGLESELASVESALNEELSALRSTVSKLDDKADRAAVTSLESRIDELETDVEAVDAFRERLSGAFMGGAGAGAAAPDGDENEE
ncbi:hypothetical protein [Natronocalculus amylovorans]|uniref:Uncharacterized protein n=1 Tax=Natronocalculus amylovorans TaxID=2917812 RepID=A0AAE3FXC2_9EURY|nr:hypothetical protein [Natronocalculus amylovorans]MCL9817307.1 hypothetical protein [Natronocalculus amylovorans]